MAFANTGEDNTTLVRGRPAVPAPPGSSAQRWNRTNNAGPRKARRAEYAAAIAQGHEVIAAVFEVTGAANPEVVQLLHELADAHENKLPLNLRGASWTATTFLAHFKQRISMTIHKACASKLKYQLRINQPKKPKKPRMDKKAAASRDMANFGVAGLAPGI